MTNIMWEYRHYYGELDEDKNYRKQIRVSNPDVWKSDPVWDTRIADGCRVEVYEDHESNLWMLIEEKDTDIDFFHDFFHDIPRTHVYASKGVFPLSAFYCGTDLYFICDDRRDQGISQMIVSKLPDGMYKNHVWQFDDFKPIRTDNVVKAVKTDFGFFLVQQDGTIVLVNDDFETQSSFKLENFDADSCCDYNAFYDAIVIYNKNYQGFTLIRRNGKHLKTVVGDNSMTCYPDGNKVKYYGGRGRQLITDLLTPQEMADLDAELLKETCEILEPLCDDDESSLVMRVLVSFVKEDVRLCQLGLGSPG